MIVLLLLMKALLANSKGVLFKDKSNDKFIGKDPSTGQLKLVDYKEAIRFKLEELTDISTKMLKDSKSENKFTETGWWLMPKNYYMQDENNESKQGFQIVYYDPGEYILMREGYCLSAHSGVFKKVYCKKGEVNIFKMCTNKKCHDEMNDLKKDIKKIKKALYNGMPPDMMPYNPAFLNPNNSDISPYGPNNFDQNPYKRDNKPENQKKDRSSDDWSGSRFSEKYGNDDSDSDSCDDSDCNSGRRNKNRRDKRDSDSSSDSDNGNFSCVPVNPWALARMQNKYPGYRNRPFYGPGPNC